MEAEVRWEILGLVGKGRSRGGVLAGHISTEGKVLEFIKERVC